MAELHKNQVAWSAPDAAHVKLAKNRGFIAPAANQLTELSYNIAKMAAAEEDNTIESVMKQTQDEALNWLSNQQERNPADYEKHVFEVSSRLRNKLNTFSKDAVSRFNRNNPEYFDAVTLSANKIILDKRTKQLANTVKSDTPTIASEAAAMATKASSPQGTAEAYNYGLNKIQEMVAFLPIEEQDARIYDYKSQFGGFMLQSALGETDPKNLVDRVTEVVDNIDLTPNLTPQQREYYKQLAGQKAISIEEERQNALDNISNKNAPELQSAIYAELDGYLAGGQYSLYAQAVDEYRYLGGRISGKDENGNPIVTSVLGEGKLTKEQLNSILTKVKEQEPNYYAYQQEKDVIERDMMLSNAALVGAIESGQNSAAVIAEEQLAQMVRNPRVRKLAGSTDVYKDARDAVIKREAAAMEAVTPPITVGAAMYKTDGWFAISDHLSPIQSSSYKIAAMTDRSPTTKNKLTGSEGTAFYGAGKVKAHEFIGGTDVISVEEYRTVGEPMRQWQIKAYGIGKSDVEYYGSVLEVLNVMTPILAANPAFVTMYGFPANVNPYIIREAGTAVARRLGASGQWNEDAVTEDSGTDKIKQVFDILYKEATGFENPVTASSNPEAYVAQQTFFNELAVGSKGGAGSSRVSEAALDYISSGGPIDLKGFANRPITKSLGKKDDKKD